MKEKFDSIHEDWLLGQAFLDCGAYSVLTGQWEELPLADYERFVAKHWRSFKIIAAPDVIGSAVGTIENFMLFISYMKAAGVWDKLKGRVAITYHLSDREVDLMHSFMTVAYNNGVRWFAVGGIVDPRLNHQQRFIGISSVLQQVDRDRFKVHLFGGHQQEFIRVFRPDSVDSSSYVAAGKNLTAVHYVNWKAIKTIMPRDSQQKQLVVIASIITTHFAYLLHELEVEIAALIAELKGMPDGIRMWLVNGLAIIDLENQIRARLRNPEFIYWVTMDPSMFHAGAAYGPISKKIFARIWKDRCLVAYPQYWEANTEGRNLANLGYFK